MTMNRIEGIIYRVQPYQETSRLLQVYTPRGKISVLARGSQKLNSDLRILAQYLNHIEFDDYQDKTFINLTNVKLINDFQTLKTNYQRMKDISLVTEIISKVYLDFDSHEKIFKLIIEVLNSDNRLASLSFALKMLYVLGYGMDLKGDGRKIKGLNITKGGLVYTNEDIKTDLGFEDTIELLKLTYSKIDELPDLSQKSEQAIKQFIDNYYMDKLEIKLKAIEQ